MKKVLLCCKEFFGYELKIIDELKKQGYFVEFFEWENFYLKNRKIKNPILRLINNLYYKKFTKIDLRDRLIGKKFIKILSKYEDKEFDYFLKIGPIKLDEDVLKFLPQKFKKTISHHWDTVGFILEEDDILEEKRYFDRILSYDKEDCKKYELFYLPNFYQKSSENIKIKQDVYSLMIEDGKRKEILEKIAIILKALNKSYSFSLYTKKNIKSELINITSKKIPVTEMIRRMEESRVVVEILRGANKGCTFRTIDCIGIKKKLITNNPNIIDEDFYNPNNILVIDENNIEIPKEFIESSYEELSEEIYRKYGLTEWIKTLLKD